jgi:hypothetical protein
MGEVTVVNLIILGLCIICFRIYHTYEKLGHSCKTPIVITIWVFWVIIASIVKTVML